MTQNSKFDLTSTKAYWLFDVFSLFLVGFFWFLLHQVNFYLMNHIRKIYFTQSSSVALDLSQLIPLFSGLYIFLFTGYLFSYPVTRDFWSYHFKRFANPSFWIFTMGIITPFILGSGFKCFLEVQALMGKTPFTTFFESGFLPFVNPLNTWVPPLFTLLICGGFILNTFLKYRKADNEKLLELLVKKDREKIETLSTQLSNLTNRFKDR